MRISVALVGLVMVFLVSCDSSEPPLGNIAGQEFFPLKMGATAIYQVDSTVIRFNEEVVHRYQAMHAITGSFVNPAGGTTYIISRFKRANENEAWNALPTWQARITEREAVQVEGNNPYVKLAFPVRVGVEWNGNRYNNLGGPDTCEPDFSKCDLYSITGFDNDYLLINNTPVESVVVTEHNDPDLIAIHDVRTSVYAKNMGLVERTYVYLKYCTDDDCRGKQEVEEGLRYHMKLLKVDAQ